MSAFSFSKELNVQIFATFKILPLRYLDIWNAYKVIVSRELLLTSALVHFERKRKRGKERRGDRGEGMTTKECANVR